MWHNSIEDLKLLHNLLKIIILKICHCIRDTPFFQLNQPLPSRTCDDGTKYLLNRVCDGIMDCADGSDETEALCNEVCHSPHIWVSQNNCLDGDVPYLGVYNIIDAVF